MDKAKDTNSLKQMGFITANYVKFPAVSPCVFRLEDIVACFYTKKYLCQDGGYDCALIAYVTDDELGFMQRNPRTEPEDCFITSLCWTNGRFCLP